MRTTALAIAFIVLPTVANAQIGNPGFMSPDTKFNASGIPAPKQPNASDKLFAQLATAGGLAEVSFAQLAVDKAQASAVGEYAQRMKDDHSAANKNLASIADDNNVPLPKELNPEHAAMRDQFKKLNGADFDLAYMRGQVVNHQKTATLLIWEIGSGQDAKLQQFATATLPTVLEHLRLAREIVADLSSNQVAKN